MLLSARGACELLAETGLARRHARLLLLAGFAGAGQRTTGALLYEEHRVRQLLDWPRVELTALDRSCTGGLFVARVGPREAASGRFSSWQGADLSAPVTEQLAAVRGPWDLSPWTRVLLRERIVRDGFVPFIASVSGYVAVTAAITAVTVERRSSCVLDLSPAAQWARPFHQARFPTGPGSPWMFWTAGGARADYLGNSAQ